LSVLDVLYAILFFENRGMLTLDHTVER